MDFYWRFTSGAGLPVALEGETLPLPLPLTILEFSIDSIDIEKIIFSGTIVYASHLSEDEPSIFFAFWRARLSKKTTGYWIVRRVHPRRGAREHESPGTGFFLAVPKINAAIEQVIAMLINHEQQLVENRVLPAEVEDGFILPIGASRLIH